MYHLYVDDVHLYLPFEPKVEKGAEHTAEILSLFTSDNSQWMTDNKLKLYNEKNEFFVISSHHYINFFLDISIQIGNFTITQSPTIKSPGVNFDQAMSLTDNVKSIITSVNFHLCNIYRIHRFITSDNCQNLTCSLHYFLLRLHKQNCAVRIVFRFNRKWPSAPLLKELHWLLLESCVIFKLMIFADFFQATWGGSLSAMFHHDWTYDLVTTAHLSLELARNILSVINLLLM